MAAAVEEVVGSRVNSGVVTVKEGHLGRYHLHRVTAVEAAHPEPNHAGIEGATRALELLRRAGESDLVIAVISGGGSALWPLPAEGIGLQDVVATTSLLLASGASIDEINSVRKHISAIQGGQAARAAAPARVLVPVVSDVVGDRLDVIASGPFFSDRSTFDEAYDVVAGYGLIGELPLPILQRLERGRVGELPETPKPEERFFGRVRHVLVASNASALSAASDSARRHGYTPIVLTSSLTGDVAEAAEWFCGRLRKATQQAQGPLAILCGGETTVSLGKSTGKGGRNQEFALRCALRIAGADRRTTVLSCGTDGSDGPTDAAGAVVDNETVVRIEELGMSVNPYLANHDSYHLLDELGLLVKTGPTLTNVMDIQVGLVEAAS